MDVINKQPVTLRVKTSSKSRHEAQYLAGMFLNSKEPSRSLSLGGRNNLPDVNASKESKTKFTRPDPLKSFRHRAVYGKLNQETTVKKARSANTRCHITAGDNIAPEITDSLPSGLQVVEKNFNRRNSLKDVSTAASAPDGNRKSRVTSAMISKQTRKLAHVDSLQDKVIKPDQAKVKTNSTRISPALSVIETVRKLRVRSLSANICGIANASGRVSNKATNCDDLSANRSEQRELSEVAHVNSDNNSVQQESFARTESILTPELFKDGCNTKPCSEVNPATFCTTAVQTTPEVQTLLSQTPNCQSNFDCNPSGRLGVNLDPNNYLITTKSLTCSTRMESLGSNQHSSMPVNSLPWCDQQNPQVNPQNPSEVRSSDCGVVSLICSKTPLLSQVTALQSQHVGLPPCETSSPVTAVVKSEMPPRFLSNDLSVSERSNSTVDSSSATLVLCETSSNDSEPQLLKQCNDNSAIENVRIEISMEFCNDVGEIQKKENHMSQSESSPMWNQLSQNYDLDPACHDDENDVTQTTFSQFDQLRSSAIQLDSSDDSDDREDCDISIETNFSNGGNSNSRNDEFFHDGSLSYESSRFHGSSASSPIGFQRSNSSFENSTSFECNVNGPVSCKPCATFTSSADDVTSTEYDLYCSDRTIHPIARSNSNSGGDITLFGLPSDTSCDIPLPILARNPEVVNAVHETGGNFDKHTINHVDCPGSNAAEGNTEIHIYYVDPTAVREKSAEANSNHSPDGKKIKSHIARSTSSAFGSATIRRDQTSGTGRTNKQKYSTSTANSPFNNEATSMKAHKRPSHLVPCFTVPRSTASCPNDRAIHSSNLPMTVKGKNDKSFADGADKIDHFVKQNKNRPSCAVRNEQAHDRKFRQDVTDLIITPLKAIVTARSLKLRLKNREFCSNAETSVNLSVTKTKSVGLVGKNLASTSIRRQGGDPAGDNGKDKLALGKCRSFPIKPLMLESRPRWR